MAEFIIQQDVYKSKQDTRRHLLFMPESPKAVVLQMCGLGVKHNFQPHIERASSFARNGYVVIAPELRGHESNRTEYRRPLLEDMLTDCDAIIQYSRNRFPALPLISIGESFAAYPPLLHAAHSKETADIYYSFGIPPYPLAVMKDSESTFAQSFSFLQKFIPEGDFERILDAKLPDFLLRLYMSVRFGLLKEALYILEGEKSKHKRGMHINPVRDKEAMANFYVRAPSLFGFAEQIEQPVVLIHSKYDRLVRPIYLDGLLERFQNKNSELLWIDAKMHAVYMWRPESVNLVIDNLKRRNIVS